jgi:hypothetical protein
MSKGEVVRGVRIANHGLWFEKATTLTLEELVKIIGTRLLGLPAKDCEPTQANKHHIVHIAKYWREMSADNI